MNFWIIKCSEKNQGWHWEDYFLDEDTDEHYPFGGSERIKSPEVRKWIREDMDRGDFALCYQTEGRLIFGVTRIASSGYAESDDDPDTVASFDLIAPGDAYLFTPPLTVDELRQHNCHPEGFTTEGRGRGALAPLSEGEFIEILDVALTLGSATSDDLNKWLSVEEMMRQLRIPDSIEDQPCTVEELDSRIAELESELNGRDDVYVAKRVEAMCRRDAALVQALKEKYNHQCQWPECNAYIPMASGKNYCEVAHIKPISKGGEPNSLNLLVLCPNHHKTLDYGDVGILCNTIAQLKLKVNGDVITINRS